MRITPENILTLNSNQIFVFGSNERGVHGAGAAKLAYNKFGARIGQGFGLAGKTFGIPTKDWKLETLDLDCIFFYVHRFIEFTKTRPDLEFLVTLIGCGLAGYKPEDIGPLFLDAKDLKNVYLPKEFRLTFEQGKCDLCCNITRNKDTVTDNWQCEDCVPW